MILISENTGEARETSFLYQRISILVQRFNAVLLHDSLPATTAHTYDRTQFYHHPGVTQKQRQHNGRAAGTAAAEALDRDQTC